MFNEIAKGKMNDLMLMKVKGGHSWPPVNVEEKIMMLNAAISVQRTGIAAGGTFYNGQPGNAAWLCFVDEAKSFRRALFAEPELLLIVAHS